MPSNDEIMQLARTVVREIDQYGPGAAFTAYVNVEPQDGIQHVFIVRGTLHPARPPSSDGVQYVRYRLPLGRIAETTPGETAVVRVPLAAGPHVLQGQFYETGYEVLSRNVFRVQSLQNVIEAVDNQIAFPDGTAFVAALKRWIARTTEEIEAEAAKPSRRRIAERFELADVPVVDSCQGDIWRLDIRRFIVITGAPGTGKTTTAIKRIAQKTDAAALVESNEVTGISDDTLRNWLGGPTNWVLLTPSDLLRNYLQQALGQEGLPATEEQVPVWGTTKIRIARDALRLIGQDRPFTLKENLVARRDSRSLTAWVRGFYEHVVHRIHEEIQRESGEYESALEGALSDLGKVPVSEVSEAQQEAASIWKDVSTLGKNQEAARLSRTLNDALRLKARLQQFRASYPDAVLGDEANRIKRVIAAANDVVTKFTDEADGSVDAVLRKLPFLYQEYRLRTTERMGFYRPEMIGAVNDRRIDPLELDGLIYVALLTVRGAFDKDDCIQRQGGSLTQRVLNELRYVVVVDEATDFSAVELACMRLLAHPVFDCATFSGDLMQRMTDQGIGDWQELKELVKPPELHELRFSYRQTKKLLKIAARLYEQSIGRPAPFEAGFAERADDPDALWYRDSARDSTAQWLAQRIGEIYEICGQRLPSIAVLVPDESSVAPLTDLIRQPLLEAYGIETEACLEGRILGTQAKVRVFSVQFIKGLEFEAAFFVDVDRMAQMAPGLVDRFLYVGLTRARYFLGVTTQGDLPDQLAHVAEFFRQHTWGNLVKLPITG